MVCWQRLVRGQIIRGGVISWLHDGRVIFMVALFVVSLVRTVTETFIEISITKACITQTLR